MRLSLCAEAWLQAASPRLLATLSTLWATEADITRQIAHDNLESACFQGAFQSPFATLRGIVIRPIADEIQ